MLRMVAHTLELAVWRTDHVGRWADDQFLVILNGCSGDSLRAVGDRIGRMLASDGMAWRERSDPSPSPLDMLLLGWRYGRIHARAGEAEHANRLQYKDLQCDDLQLKDLQFKDLYPTPSVTKSAKGTASGSQATAASECSPRSGLVLVSG
jgi:GGDEF domain-containing protein